MALWPRWRLTGLGWLFVGLCAIFALGGQLLMEFRGGAGERDTSLDPRHSALVITMMAIALLGTRLWGNLRSQAAGRRDFHRLLKQSLSELPYAGRGPGFFLTIAATTFGMGLLACIGERGPSTIHDAIGWLIVALIVAVIAAIAARFIVRVLPDLIAVIWAFFVAIDSLRPAAPVHGYVPVMMRRECWSPPLFSRPPPPLQL